MNTYVIFVRTSTPDDPRVRWMAMIDIEATSKPDALRRFTAARSMTPVSPITRTTDCVRVVTYTDHGEVPSAPYLAWPEDRIDFDHYDFDGTLITHKEN